MTSGPFGESRARQGAAPAIACASAGALIGTGQAPLGWWFVALPALSWLLWLIVRGATPAAAAWRGWVAGVGYFAATMFWIVEPFLVDVARHGWMAPFALVFLAGGMALFWAAAAALGVGLAGPSRRLRLACVVVALALADLARGYLLTGFPWALLGHVWIGTPVAQGAALAGPVGLTLLAGLIAALPLAAPGAMPRAGGTVAALAVLGAAMWGGLWRLDHPPPDRERPITVRMLQPNAAQHLKWDPGMIPVFFDRQLGMTAAPGDPSPDLIVWPETAVPYMLENAAPALRLMAEAAGGTPLATGIQRREGARAYNSLAVLGPDGTPTSVYDKHHLVPFGEYLPFGDVLARFGLRGFAAQDGAGYSAGPGPRVLDLGPGVGRVLPLICYEAIFPRDLRSPDGRADWVLQVTNDGWFGNVSGPWQHLAQARLRAIEQGLPLLRSANTGITAVIDAQGRVLDSLALNAQGTIDATVPGALPPTPYARTGDAPVLALLLLLGAGIAALRLRVTA